MLRYSYECDCGEEFTVWQESGKATDTQPCPKCKRDAERLVGFSMIKTDSHLMSRAWEKKREKKLAQERKLKE